MSVAEVGGKGNVGTATKQPPPIPAMPCARGDPSEQPKRCQPSFRSPDRLVGCLCLSFSATNLRTFLLALCSLSPKPPAEFSPGEPQKAGRGECWPSKGPPNHTCRKKAGGGVAVLLAAQSLALFSLSDQYQKGQLQRLGSVLFRGLLRSGHPKEGDRPGPRQLLRFRLGQGGQRFPPGRYSLRALLDEGRDRLEEQKPRQTPAEPATAAGRGSLRGPPNTSGPSRPRRPLSSRAR